MKPKVYSHDGLWRVTVTGNGGFSSMAVDDWSEAIRIALRAQDNPLKLVDIGFLRQMGKTLDKDFRV